MKHILMWSLFTFYCQPSFGQSQLQKYHDKINNAELFITDGKFEQALDYYDIAFELNKKPFAQDIYNAAICAIKLNLNKKAGDLAFDLAEKGVGALFFEKKAVFIPLRSEACWGNLITKAENAKEKFNANPLNIKIQTMVAADQKMHMEWFSSDHIPNGEMENRMTHVDDSLSAELMDLFNEHGYLSEEQIGVKVFDDTAMSLMPAFGIIILHNYQGRIHSDTLFSPVLNTAMQQGKIKPEVVTSSFQDNGTNMGNRPYYGTHSLYMIYKCTLYSNKYFRDSAYLDKISDARKLIGLYPLTDYIKKMMFNIGNPKNEFRINAHCGRIGSFADPSSENSFLQNRNIVMENIPGCKP